MGMLTLTFNFNVSRCGVLGLRLSYAYAVRGVCFGSYDYDMSVEEIVYIFV